MAGIKIMDGVASKSFSFKKGGYWDGDEEIVDYIMDLLLAEPKIKGGVPKIRTDCIIRVEYVEVMKKDGSIDRIDTKFFPYYE
jgi:hypothetical protein